MRSEIGIPISIIALIVGIIYSTKYVAKTFIDPNPDITDTEINQKLKEAPSAFLSSLPVILPIVLIIIRSVIKSHG